MAGKVFFHRFIPHALCMCVLSLAALSLLSCDGFLGVHVMVFESTEKGGLAESRIFQINSGERDPVSAISGYISAEPLKDATVEVLENSGGGEPGRYALLQTDENGVCSGGKTYAPRQYDVIIRVYKDGYDPAEIKMRHTGADPAGGYHDLIVFLARSSE